jgi:hypothetical protein
MDPTFDSLSRATAYTPSVLRSWMPRRPTPAGDQTLDKVDAAVLVSADGRECLTTA